MQLVLSRWAPQPHLNDMSRSRLLLHAQHHEGAMEHPQPQHTKADSIQGQAHVVS